MKTIVPVFRIALTILCVASFRQTQAVTPPPDGGYPNFTTAEGTNALKNLGSGAANTGIGWYSLFMDSTGGNNTGVGAATLALNNGDSNTAVGTGALFLNTGGSLNTAVGTGALVYNDSGIHNTAVGAFALYSNIGNVNRGSENTAIGYQALFSTNGSMGNTANWNTATGSQALYSNTDGRFNSAFGYQALFNSDLGEENSAFGFQALYNNQSFAGFANSAFGSNALHGNIDGELNSAFGNSALATNVHGDDNAAIGASAGAMIDGNGNVCIGAFVAGESGVDNSTYIRNVNTLTQNFSAGVNNYVTVRLTDGRLGNTSVVSSRRYKEDIKSLDRTSEALYALKPVSFRLKKEYDDTQALGFGLIAEEVEKVNPALVYRNNKGQVESVRYEMINAMLLNEFLKAHRKMEEQEATIAQLKADGVTQQAVINDLKKRLETVVVRLEEHDSKIERANDRLELRQPVPKLAVSNP